MKRPGSTDITMPAFSTSLLPPNKFVGSPRGWEARCHSVARRMLAVVVHAGLHEHGLERLMGVDCGRPVRILAMHASDASTTSLCRSSSRCVGLPRTHWAPAWRYSGDRRHRARRDRCPRGATGVRSAHRARSNCARPSSGSWCSPGWCSRPSARRFDRRPSQLELACALRDRGDVNALQASPPRSPRTCDDRRSPRVTWRASGRARGPTARGRAPCRECP